MSVLGLGESAWAILAGPAALLIGFACAGAGLAGATLMRSGRDFDKVMIALLPLLLLSGVFFPVNNVPGWLEAISKINPLTYGVDAIRQLFLGAASGATDAVGVTVFGHTMTVAEDAGVVAVFGLLLLLLATVSFGRQE